MPEDTFQGAECHVGTDARFSHFWSVGILASVILIQLQPKVSQHIWGIVDVSDGLLALDGLVGIVQFYVDDIVGLLLPVQVARCT